MISIARPPALTKLPLGRIGLAAVLLAAITVAAPLAAQEMKPMPAPASEMGMMSADAPVIPAVTGYSEGRTILFIHTERGPRGNPTRARSELYES